MLNINKIFNAVGFFKDLKRKDHTPAYGALDIFKYIGPGLLVTVGFIDPGNWAANIATGSGYGYTLLWIVTLSTVMLIILQHNVAHLGIATGLCLSEAATIYIHPKVSKTILSFAILASVSTSLAEILGGAIALNMLFDLPVKAGAILVTIFVMIMLFTNSYRKTEKWIIGFVSIIGLSFLYELFLVDVDWVAAGIAWVKPSIPEGSMLLLMSVLGAVVMPHNLFLHSEVIQSRQWNLQDEKIIKKQLKFEFADTLFSMIIGWAINSAMIILAAATFFKSNIKVDELQQAETLLEPLLGTNASVVFAVALLFAGVASTITSGMAGGSIFSGMYKEPYDIKDSHSRIGIIISLVGALIMIFFIGNPFKGLILSQVFLSIQLPFTVAIQVYLTSSKRVMGKYVNSPFLITLLIIIAGIVSFLNIKLLIDFLVVYIVLNTSIMPGEKYKIGLVLSGGGARGFAHLGVIQALNETGIFPDVISGTSAGALAGVLYADGYKPKEILKLLNTGSRLDFMRPALPREGLLQIGGVIKILKTSLRASTFEELKINMFVAATDLNNGKAVYFSKGKLLDPVIASASIPVLFQPVVINNICYVDGGVLDNLPIRPIENKCSFIIGSFVNPVGYMEKVSGLINIAERSFLLRMSEEINEKADRFDLFIAPLILRNFGILDPEKADELFSIGYEITKEKLKDIDIDKLLVS